MNCRHVSTFVSWLIPLSWVRALELPPDKIRYRARVAYHGASFSGFQLQSRKITPRTVQGVLETSIQQSFGLKGERLIKVVGAGRTDAGVHARGQAIHFDAPITALTAVSDVQNALEDCLPNDIVVWNLQVAPSRLSKVKDGVSTVFPWSAMYDATYKLYIYRLSLGSVMDPIDQHCRWHVPFYKDVDPQEFEKVLQLFVGTHDFRAFSASEVVGASCVRTVYAVKVIDEGNDGHYRIEFLLKGALHKQVRNMVGSALDQARRPGKHRRGADVKQLLVSGAPRKDNPTEPAPPQGLTLECVYYDDF